ncbi:MAG: cobalamin-binding protein [Actinomycetota bacterium]|nr:cobalamin-binding protein [Actinomycetota bacterium]
MRIVSLLPSATEIVYALGLEGSLAAVTSDCDYPPDAAEKPQASFSSLPLDDDTTPNEIDRLVKESVEANEPIYRLDRALIQELQPDLILAQDLCRVCAVPSGHVTEALDVIGCDATVISLDPHGLDDVIAGIEEVGDATGTSGRAKELAARLRERVQTVRAKARGLSQIPTLALEWADPPFTGGHWIPEMIELAGGRDLVGVQGEPSTGLSWHAVEAAAPELIVFMPCGYRLPEAVVQARDLYAREEFAATPAAHDGAVFAVDSSSYFSRPGPRLIDGLETLAWILHPDVFPEPPPGRVERVGPV